MLRKLLKYDMMSVWKGGWGVLPIMAACTVIASLAANLLNADSSNYADHTSYALAIIVFFVCVFGIVACGVIIGNLVFVRFYKNFYTDEGYLTFTLPASRKILLFSKTLNTLIWETAHTVLILICALIYFIIVPPGGEDSIINPIVFE